MSEGYRVGDLVTLTFQHYLNDVLADVYAMQDVEVYDPDGDLAYTLTPSKISTGQYQTSYIATSAGLWNDRWKYTGENGEAERTENFYNNVVAAYVERTISQPTVTSLTRNGATGSATISVEDEAYITTYAYFVNPFGGSNVLAGSIVGSGVMELDFQNASTSGIDALPGVTLNAPVPRVLFYSTDGNGNFSEPLSVELCWGLIEIPSNYFVISDYVRNGATATFTLSNMVAGYTAFALYNKGDNSLGLKTLVAGVNTITGLTPLLRYNFMLFVNSASGVFGIPARQFGDVIGAPDANTPIIEQIVSNIKSTVESVTTANNYRVTIGKVIRATGFPAPGDPMPLVVVDVINQDPPVLTSISAEQTVDVGILGWVRAADQAAATNLVVAEIERAIMNDLKRGGLATYTEVRNRRQTIRKVGSPKAQPYGYFEMEIKVGYEHKFYDPFVQS